mmetsp:Transcript_31660/g.57656  ORF Transcript_31660/g.57656 Transcript_31660/m.57656 type:complete len:129 (-) Transcript_31660:42-428(-)
MMMQAQMMIHAGSSGSGQCAWPAFSEYSASVHSQSPDVEVAGSGLEDSEPQLIRMAAHCQSSVLGKDFHVGQVKSYNPQKGFGFIRSNAVEGDIYFKGMFEQLQGRQVSFKLNIKGGRNQANCIEVLD